MTNFPSNLLKQKCVYWGNPQPTGFGSFTFDEPVELDCRWEAIDMTTLSTYSINSNVRSEVYLDQDVDENGMLLLGELVDLDSSVIDDPIAAGASTIVRFDKIPSLKVDKFVRKAFVGILWTGRT